MIGKTISHYKILEKLCEGGMGVVYKAEDTKLKRFVALKFLSPQLSLKEEALTRFIYEAQTASSLDHQNICRIYEIDISQNDQLLIAMAYYDGETLKQKIARRLLTIEEAVEIAIQTACGLAKVHEKGIIHRDIKPANIIVQPDGTVKIIDFGLSKLAGMNNISKSGSILGTVAYMSEEQALGKEIDFRSDIWSLGVVMYEMLTGQLPFQAEHEQTVIYYIINKELKPVSALRPEVSIELERIVEKALQKEPGKRYKNMAEMLDGLKTVRAIMDSGVTRFRKGFLITHKRRRIVLRGAIVTLIITLAAFGYFYMGSNETSAPVSIAVVGFENMTGDSTYNNLQKVLPNLFITSLEQSPYLQVLTWERLKDLLKQTGREDVDIIDKDTGFELCRRTGINIILTGSFIIVGDLFVTDVKVLDVKTKDLIRSASSKGTGIASILDIQIDKITDEIAKNIGVPARKAETIPTRIAEVTTSSLEAYNYFIRGREEWEKVNPMDAVKFLTKAIQLDSTFASAYLYLGISEMYLNNTKARNIAYKKAKKYSTKASTKEQLYIEMSYTWVIEHNIDKALQIINLMSNKYPNEKTVFQSLGYYYGITTTNYDKAIPAYETALEIDPYYQPSLNQLAYVFVKQRKYEKALKYFQRLAAVSPGDPNPFDSMADCYFAMGKIEEACLKYKEATDVDNDFIWSYIKRAYIYALYEDYSTTLEICDQAILSASTAGFKALGHYCKGFYLFWLGQMDQALQVLQKSRLLWSSVENAYGIAQVEWIEAWISYERGKYDLAKKQMKNWFMAMSGYSPPRIPGYKTFYNFHIGFFELQQVLIDSAAVRLQQIKTLLPDIKENLRSSRIRQHKILESEILLKRGKTAQAIDLYNNIKAIDMDFANQWNWLPYNVPFYHDLIPRAYSKGGEIEQAIEEYNRLIKFNPEKKERYLIQPRYHYRLAQLYEKSGEANKAIKQYQIFLKIWKNADPELPELIDAKSRYAKLKGVTEK